MYITKKFFLTRCIALWVILALMVTLIPTAPYAVGQEEKKPDGGGTTDTPQETPNQQQAEAPPERVSDDDEEQEEPAEQEESEEEETPAPTLSNLTVSDTNLNEPFDAETTAYTADVAHTSETVTISATPTDDTMTVTYDPTDADTEEEGQQVNLTEGENTVTITVTAEDGVTVQTYTLTITRAAEEPSEPEDSEEEEEESVGGENEETEEEEETPEPTAEPAPEQPQPQAQQQQQVQLPDDDDTAGTQAYTAPTGALTLDLKTDSDSGSSTTDDITKNTSLTFTVSSGANFGGTDSSNASTVGMIYKNEGCSSGTAIPADGTNWGHSSNNNGFHNDLPVAWRNSATKESTGTPATSFDVTFDIAGKPWGSSSLTVPTVTDGVKCFIAAFFAGDTATVSSSNTSAGLEVTIDTTATTPSLSISSGAGSEAPVVAITNLESNGKVRLYTDSDCSASNALGSDDTSVGASTTTASITLSGRSASDTFYAKHTDVAGNTACSSSGVSNVSVLTLDLTSDTGDTTDDRTSDTTPAFTVTGETAYGGSASNEVRLYHKNTACGILPTDITTTTGLTDWTLYKTTDVSASPAVTTTTGITSDTALTTTDEHCFLAVYSSDGSAITRYGQLDVVIDTTAPTIIPRVAPSYPSGTPTKFSHAGDVAVTLDNRDFFGSATALSADGTLMAVGVLSDDDGGSDRGAVHLFEKTDATWTKTLKISDNNGGTELLDINLDNSDAFGTTVSLSADGTLLAVGADSDDDGGGGNKGAVYLFEKTSTGWAKTLKISDNANTAGLLDINLDTGDRFGSAAALSADGTALAVGAIYDDDGGRNADRGAVYLFEKTSTGWAKTLKISDNDGGTELLDINLDDDDDFGISVALSADGTALAVGAKSDDDGEAVIIRRGRGRTIYDTDTDRGAVYLFEKSDGTWAKTLKISDNDGGSAGLLDINLDVGDLFGNAVSLVADGTLLAVGAQDDDDNGRGKGAVYLFQKSDTAWAKTLKISDNNGGSAGLLDINLTTIDRFGSGVSLAADGTALAVGARNDSSTKGAVYAFSVSPKLTVSATVTAVDTEDSSTMKYMKTTGTACTATQFAGGTGTPYTEGDEITVATEADNNKHFCFKSEDGAGNSSYGISAVLNIDTTAPVLTPIRTGTDNTATYIVTAADNSPLTGVTKDNVALADCTDTTTTDNTWTSYTPGDDIGTADDTNGRCVIITDAAGNSKAQHLLDSDNTIRADFTLDITGNGTANYLDAIVHYYYAQNPIDQSAGGAVMANFINANDSPTNTENQTDTAAIYTTMQDSATTRDFTGNGTTNYLDAIVHYYYAQNPIDQSAGGAVMANFINANDSPTNTENQTNTAAIYTLLQNFDL